MSERFVTLYEEECIADTVKRIKIQWKEPFYLISLIEHKISVDYNVGMHVLRYRSRIWEDYAKEMEIQAERRNTQMLRESVEEAQARIEEAQYF